MKCIYDFEDIQKISKKQKNLIISYFLALLGFFCVLALICIYVENNILLSFLFAVLLFSFILSSIVFWKVKYGMLSEYKAFLDNMETVSKNDYEGTFEGVEVGKENGEPFDEYVFCFSNKKTVFLVHSDCPQELKTGEKYHIEHVGKYVYSWKTIE